MPLESALPPVADRVTELNRRYRHHSAADVLAHALSDPQVGRIAMVSSFGAESVALLHMVSVVDRSVPVIFLDTQMLFPETLEYQREVADRIVAAPGTSAYGALAVGVQSVAEAQFLFGVPKGAFRPVPKVESAVVRITPHAPPRLSVEDEGRLRRLTRAAFQWRRKQLQKTLRDHPDVGTLPSEVVARIGRELDFDLTRRPETFSPDELLRLARTLD